MDLATASGLVISFALLAGAIVLGGSFVAFMNLPSLLIVLGGTFAITVACFSLSDVIAARKILSKGLVNHAVDPTDAADAAIHMAIDARENGVLSLQAALRRYRDVPFLAKALQMVVDGAPADEIDRVLGQDIDSMSARHATSADILRKAAEVAPGMGLIGTLIGLIQMLTKLDDPASIGPAMAVALLTTFYGAVLATMVFSPLAAKLERNSEDEVLLNRLYSTAAASISRQENPRRLEMLLNTMLPPAKQLHVYD